MLALNYATVANVLFMQAAAPMMAALLGWVFLRERVDGRTWVALALAAVGVAVMAAGSFDAGTLAVVLPFLVAASFAVVIVIARHRRDVSMMPATCASQVLVVLACLPFLSISSASESDWAILAGLGIGQMGAGLALLTIGARLIPAAQVAILSLLELVLGPLWVWLAYGERPATATVAGGVVVVTAVLVQATGDLGVRTRARRGTPLAPRNAVSRTERETVLRTWAVRLGGPRPPVVYVPLLTD